MIQAFAAKRHFGRRGNSDREEERYDRDPVAHGRLDKLSGHQHKQTSYRSTHCPGL